MIKASITVLLGLVIAAPAAAHDFWLQPEAFRMAEPGPLLVQARVGHSDELSIWHTPPARIIAFHSVGPAGVTDQQSRLYGDPTTGLLAPVLPRPGLHVLSLTSIHAQSDLPADRFNAYVEEEGVRPILADRVMRGAMERNGREIYSRRAKSLILVGGLEGAADDHVTRPIGLTLEIIPLTNPMRSAADAAFEFEVRYRGLPLAGALVHVQRLSEHPASMAPMRTDADGRATFDPGDPGDPGDADSGGGWMLHTVWSSPISGDPRGDYDTIFSSLTFSLAEPS